MIDKYSATWKDVDAWATNELNAARERNDDVRRGPEETAALRGRIKALKELLALADPPKRKRVTPEEEQ